MTNLPEILFIRNLVEGKDNSHVTVDLGCMSIRGLDAYPLFVSFLQKPNVSPLLQEGIINTTPQISAKRAKKANRPLPAAISAHDPQSSWQVNPRETWMQVPVQKLSLLSPREFANAN